MFLTTGGRGSWVAANRVSEEGFLGERHKPFATGGDPNRPRFEVEGIVPPGITDERQEDRLRLLDSLD
ncbi:MAG: hypothetical protein HY720_29035, partial [Planctomycetes bacterium]|nr:hypothetical protein [Planctomycetota bacterium]